MDRSSRHYIYDEGSVAFARRNLTSIPGELEANAPSLSKQTLHSLLLSAGTTSSNQTSDNPAHPQGVASSPSPTTAKKPSYLNLACSISGYGGITTYDSKLREGFRSRDHSPGKLVGIQNGSREASPARGFGVCSASSGNFLTAPSTGKLCWTPSPVSGQLIGKSDMKHISPSVGTGQRINGTNGTDQTDATGNFNVKRISDNQRNRWLESTLSPLEKNNDCQNVVSVFESSGRHGFRTETSVETRFEVNSRSQSTVVSSTTVVSSGSLPTQYSSTLRTERIIPISVERDSSLERYSHLSEKQHKIYSNGSDPHHTSVSSKSFIQQRVERLYGPCALAQGFFHRSSKSPASASSTSNGSNGVNNLFKTEVQLSSEDAESSHELPVLRHLRPEFRDQLNVAPRRSLGARLSNGSPSSKPPVSNKTVQSSEVKSSLSQHLQQQTSTGSLADCQPAAPEVVLPQQSSSMSKKDEKIDGKLGSGICGNSEAISAETSKPSLKIVEDVLVSSAVVPTAAHTGEGESENAGHKFLKIQRETIEKLLKLAEKADREIEDDSTSGKPVLSEEALGHLRAAAGKARLLVTQKMVQFEGLCHKCISQHPDEPFPTTPEDLQGFWDMLLLQVDQVHNTFQHLDKLRAAGWCEDKIPKEEKSDVTDSPGHGTANAPNKRTHRPLKPAATNSAKAAEAAALRKQREEDRRKIMEQRRREMKQKQQNEQDSAASNETVEIFGAQPR